MKDITISVPKPVLTLPFIFNLEKVETEAQTRPWNPRLQLSWTTAVTLPTQPDALPLLRETTTKKQTCTQNV